MDKIMETYRNGWLVQGYTDLVAELDLEPKHLGLNFSHLNRQWPKVLVHKEF